MAHLIALQPFITEKAMRLAHSGQYTFLVNRGASKLAIEREVTKAYTVHVTSVNITKRPAKVKARGVQQARIKAIVTLQKGEIIKGFDLPTDQKTEDSGQKTETKSKQAAA